MPKPGDAYGRFVLHEKLGGGAMAEVYRAFATGPMGFRKEVALKRIRPDVGDDEIRSKMLEALTNEARLGAYLHHRNVVEVYDFGQIGRDFYIAMELVQGVTLEQILKRIPRQGTLPHRIVCEIALQLCAGLAAAHDAVDDESTPIRMVHRDLKPSNVMIDRKGVVKIMDFGVARAQTNLFQTEIGSVKGTPTFMSPEQVLGQDLDHRSDLFSLGSLLAEMITGHNAFRAPQVFEVLTKIAHADIDDTITDVNSVFPEMVLVLRNALQRDPAERYQSATEMSKDIEYVYDGLTGDEKLTSWIADWMAVTDISQSDTAGPVIHHFFDQEGTSALRQSTDTMDVLGPDTGWAMAAHSEGTDLSAALETAEVTTDRQPAEAPSTRPTRRWPWLVIAVVLVALAGGSVATWYYALGGKRNMENTARQRTWNEALQDVSPEIDWITLPRAVFQMGDAAGDPDELPQRRVWMSDFRISRAEVTVGQYALCVRDGACSKPGTQPGCNWGDPQRVDHPMNCASWFQATEFALWAGVRLPSEAEWEYAAKAGEDDSRYPWGQARPDCDRAVFGAESGPCGVTGTAPVCTHLTGNTAQGLCDMGGNVAEWVADGYHASYDNAPTNGSAWEAPAGLPGVLRGGSWFSEADGIRATDRVAASPTESHTTTGFRVAADAQE